MNEKFNKVVQNMKDSLKIVRENKVYRKQHLIQQGTRSFYEDCTGDGCKMCKINKPA